MVIVKSFKADARKVSFETLHGGQSTSSTQLIIPNYPVILSRRRSTTVSLETYLFYSIRIEMMMFVPWAELVVVFTPIMFPDSKLPFSSVFLEAFIDSYSPWRHQPCSSTPGSSSSWFIAVSVTCPLKTRQNSVNTTTSKDATMSSNRCSWMLRPENERQEWEMFTAQLYRSVLVYIITRVYKYY